MSEPTTIPLPPEREREIRHRAAAATPGPWHLEHSPDSYGCVTIGDYGWVAPGPETPEYDVDSDQGRSDAEFIAHAREDVPALLAELERLRGERNTAVATVAEQAKKLTRREREQNADRAVLEGLRTRVAELEAAQQRVQHSLAPRWDLAPEVQEVVDAALSDLRHGHEYRDFGPYAGSRCVRCNLPEGGEGQ